jgi:hypothetical protein
MMRYLGGVLILAAAFFAGRSSASGGVAIASLALSVPVVITCFITGAMMHGMGEAAAAALRDIARNSTERAAGEA